VEKKQSTKTPSWQAKGLEEWVKTVLIADILDNGFSVCEIVSHKGLDIGKWTRANISNYLSIEIQKENSEAVKKRWEDKQKPFNAQFVCLDAFKTLKDQMVYGDLQPKEFDVVASFNNALGLSFENEQKANIFISNVASLLKDKGVFFGIVLDSSQIWYKAAGHGNVDKEKLYVLEFENEKFEHFGTYYRLKMEGLEDSVGYLVHFPSLIRICRENKLRMLDIGNFVSYYDEKRKYYSEHLHKLGVLSKQFPALANEQKSVVQLYTTFVFQKEL